MGGEDLRGSFSISTLAGRLRGTAAGIVGFGASDHYVLTLTVERAGFLLTGTLTSNLHRVHWGHWSPVPLT